MKLPGVVGLEHVLPHRLDDVGQGVLLITALLADSATVSTLMLVTMTVEALSSLLTLHLVLTLAPLGVAVTIILNHSSGLNLRSDYPT